MILTGWASNRARGGCIKALVPGISAADKNDITPDICYVGTIIKPHSVTIHVHTQYAYM